MEISKRLLPLLLLLAFAIAGCGGGGDDEPTAAPVETTEATTALSKEELIAQGDAICAEVNAAIGAAGSTSSGGGESSQVPDLYNGMVERLKDLGPPSDDSAGYPEFISAAEQLGQAESNVGLAAGRGEEEALSAAESEATSSLASFQSAATAYGFKQCGEAPSAPTQAASGAEEPSEEEAAEGGVEEEVAPEVEEEVAPETGGAVEEESAGGGAGVGGGTGGGTEGSGGGGSSGGIGPG